MKNQDNNTTKKLEICFKVMPYGAMVWWDKCEDAAKYTLKLYIKELIDNKVTNESKVYELCSVEKDRNTMYHTFSGLAILSGSHIVRSASGSYYTSAQNYFVHVVAEDRSGAVVAKSQEIDFDVIR